MRGGDPISGSGLSIDEELERRCYRGRGNYNHEGIGRYLSNNIQAILTDWLHNYNFISNQILSLNYHFQKGMEEF